MATNITTLAMEAKPGASDVWLIEAGSRGEGRLVGRITPAGERLWYFRYSFAGQQVRMRLGGYSRTPGGVGTLTVSEARARAGELRDLYRGKTGVKDLRGHFAQVAEDKRRAEQAAREQAEAERQATAQARLEAEHAAARRVTVRQLFGMWQAAELLPQVNTDGKTTGRKDGGAYVLAQFERRLFPHLGTVPVEDVTKAQWLAVVTDAKASGRLRTAGVLLTDLKQMLAYAEELELIARNPLDKTKRAKLVGKNVERDRVLTADHVKKLVEAIPKANMGKRSALAVWLILATGCRIGEAMSARWEHFDTVAKTWHLPETKNGRDHTIHLSAFALRYVEALAELRESKADENGVLVPVPWVFPNMAADGPVCVKSFGKQLADRQRVPEKRMQHRALQTEALILPGGKWTAHDLRRTAATFMAELGISGDVIDECLNHVIESRVRRTYIRNRRLADQARAFDALGARLTALVDGEAETNVVPLRAA